MHLYHEVQKDVLELAVTVPGKTLTVALTDDQRSAVAAFVAEVEAEICSGERVP